MSPSVDRTFSFTPETSPWTAPAPRGAVGGTPGPLLLAGRVAGRARKRDPSPTLGRDHRAGLWTTDVGGWTLVGLNTQLFGSGLDTEADQWRWLEEVFAASEDHPIVLITHKPVIASAAELAEAPWHRFVPPAARRRLARLMDPRRVHS